MKALVANHSSYPPAFDTQGDRHRGKESLEDIGAVIEDQEKAGVDVVTDGQISWADPVSHLMRHLDGARRGEPQPFLDSAIRFRPPIIEAKLRCRASLTVEDYGRASKVSVRPVKAVLMGPYTLAYCSHIATTAYRNLPDLAADLSVILAQEVRDLARAGARLIQIDEPLILRRSGDIRLLRDLLEPLKVAAGDDSQLMLATYFGDAEPLYAQLDSLPADIVALDLADGHGLADVVAATGSGKILALGVTNGRSTGMEDVDSLTREVGRILHRYIHDVVYLQPSCGLGSLSRSQARAKLSLLSSVRDALDGRSMTSIDSKIR
jgi:5-methyltetrahydropteroyltriglutamate--homocysteine methyltransferase